MTAAALSNLLLEATLVLYAGAVLAYLAEILLSAEPAAARGGWRAIKRAAARSRRAVGSAGSRRSQIARSPTPPGSTADGRWDRARRSGPAGSRCPC